MRRRLDLYARTRGGAPTPHWEALECGAFSVAGHIGHGRYWHRLCELAVRRRTGCLRRASASSANVMAFNLAARYRWRDRPPRLGSGSPPVTALAISAPPVRASGSSRPPPKPAAIAVVVSVIEVERDSGAPSLQSSVPANVVATAAFAPMVIAVTSTAISTVASGCGFAIG